MISKRVELSSFDLQQSRNARQPAREQAAERVLLYLANYGQGYPREIAATYGSSVSVVLKQLTRLESGGNWSAACSAVPASTSSILAGISTGS